MRTFITWSGQLSHGVALELKDLLCLAFPTVEAFVSSEDIRKGRQWGTAITEALAQSQRGIICLTTDNYRQPWVLFEAGALTRALQQPVLYTVLVDDLNPTSLEGSPLSLFQHTRLEKDDMRRFVKQINREIENGSRTESDLENLFDRLWPDTEKAFSKLFASAPRKIVKISDLVSGSYIITGQVFRNTVIQGPAVLAILEGNTFTSCAFENPVNAEAMLWRPMNPTVSIGAIGLSRCHFQDCEFRGIGLTGSPETLEQIRGLYKQVTTSEDI